MAKSPYHAHTRNPAGTYYLVAYVLDGDGARKYINECSIIRKYTEAFKVPEDLLRIVDYIEYIIEKMPECMELHLAAALVYDNIGETILAAEHFKIYQQTPSAKKVLEFILKKLASYPKLDQNS